MAQVKAKVKCFIDNSIREEGDVFEYNGIPNDCVVIIKSNKKSDKNITTFFDILNSVIFVSFKIIKICM